MELNQLDMNEWSISWKASAKSQLGRSAKAIIPNQCEFSGEMIRRIQHSNIIRHINISCSEPIQGGVIGLQGLENSKTDALIRIIFLNGDIQNLRITSSKPYVTIPTANKKIDNVIATYTILGIEHIIFGYDHLLFVLALVLLISGVWNVIKTITAFTVAHSLTLIGVIFGYFSLPQKPVEVVIALSIIFLAVETVKASTQKLPNKVRFSQRYPWVVAFMFGLLHGFGFAGALKEIGLPKNEVPLSLFTFNIGVELGQLIIVAFTLVILRSIKKLCHRLLNPVKISVAYLIGSFAMYWFLLRLIGM